MKRERYTIKIKRRKPRARWLIRPTTRVHDEEGYSRVKEKRQERRMIEEESGGDG